MNAYEQKQEDKRQRLLNAADRHDVKSVEAYGRADMSEEKSGIPLGQPILVGHHSEGRHRRAIARAHSAMDSSVKHSKTADHLRAKADAVGSGGVSSDDPDAIIKLREQLGKRETDQANMKAANRIIRKWVKKGATHEATNEKFNDYHAELVAVSDIFTEKAARMLITPEYGRFYGFPSFKLTNNNAAIKRIKLRIAELEKQSEATSKRFTFDGVCEVVENVDENRLQIVFDGKPSGEVRATLKQNAFRWAPSQNAWQRQLNNKSRWAAKMVLKSLGEQIYS